MLPWGAGNTTEEVALGDVDGDGDLDLWIGNGGRGVPYRNELLLNDGTARFRGVPEQVPSLPLLTTSIALGDVDGDGDLDALFGNGSPFVPQANRLFLNDGAGVFSDAPGHLPAITDETHAVALGDVDGDGDLDAAVGNVGQDHLLLNDGLGFFSIASPSLPVSADATYAVAFGDVDGDADLDLFVGNNGQSRLFLNDGAGVFSDATVQLPAIVSNTQAAGFADVEGDGDLDVVLGNGPDCSGSGFCSGRENRLYLNDGQGSFSDATGQLPAEVDITESLALLDAEGDGDVDILFGNVGTCGKFACSAELNRLLLNDGTGTFAEAPTQLPGPLGWTQALAAGDLEGDGDSDLVVGNGGLGGQANRLYLNTGSGIFVDATHGNPDPTLGEGAMRLALGDVDGDGDLDVVVSDGLYLNQGGGFFVRLSGNPFPAPFSTGITDVALGDVDGDGDLDVFLGAVGPIGAPAQNRLYLNDGAGGFADATNQLPGVFDFTLAVALGDVDGDGDLDAFVGNFGPDFLYVNDGTGTFAPSTPPFPAANTTTRSLALGDVDGDGDLDALTGNLNGPSFLYLNADGSGLYVVSSTFPATVDGTNDVVFGDVDGEGDLDVLVGNTGVGLAGAANRLYRNDGSGVFTDATALLPPHVDQTSSVALADVDEDGDLDALIGNYGFSVGGQNRLYLNDGTGSFSDATAEIPTAASNAGPLVTGDIDGDGDVDVVSADGGRLRILSNLTRQVSWRGLPRIGKPLTIDLCGPPLGAWFLGASAGASSVPIPPLGTLRLDPATLLVVHAGLLDGQGRFAIPSNVPADPLLVGATLYLQAVVVAPAAFTNLEKATFTNL
jgi:hypothetical protein